MKLAIDLMSLKWWYWFVTLLAMMAGLAGLQEGFYVVIAISLVQCVHFAMSSGLTAFPTQVRLVYTLFVTLALFDPSRIFYGALLVGTVMVTLFDRCIIARVLVLMPWNKGVKLS
jgi:hypothetical protein